MAGLNSLNVCWPCAGSLNIGTLFRLETGTTVPLTGLKPLRMRGAEVETAVMVVEGRLGGTDGAGMEMDFTLI